MRTTLWLVLALLHSAFFLLPSNASTNELTTLLQQGLFEEEGNRNLDAAIAQYQTLAAEYDQNRQVAATAVFRLGECYRKLGKTNEAVGEYRKVIQDFSDQAALVSLSRQNLAALNSAPGPTANSRPGSSGVGGVGRMGNSEAEAKELQRLQALVRDSPDLINAEREPNSLTPLVNAAYAGNLEAARFLLDHGAKVNLAINGTAPLHWAVIQGNKAMVELLLASGADRLQKDSMGRTALHLAAARGYAGIVDVLTPDKHGVNEQDKSGETPLHAAASKGNTEVLRRLLASGADVNAENLAGITALSFAAADGNADAIRALLAAGADPNRGKQDLPLLAAITRSQGQEVVELLLKSDADPNRAAVITTPGSRLGTSFTDGADTPLVEAVSQNQPQVVKLLLKYKADPNLRNGRGLTALGQAKLSQSQNRTEAASYAAMAELLRQHGALDNLPDWDRILVSRPSASYSTTVFRKGMHDWNQFNLLEAVAKIYGFISEQPSILRRQSLPTSVMTKRMAAASFQFPDLQRVIIHRSTPDGRKWNSIPVDVAAILDSGDCSRNVPLNWGDVVEIPETDHPVSQEWEGIPLLQCSNLLHCVTREFKIFVQKKGTEFRPPLDYRPFVGGSALEIACYMARPVLDDSKLLRFSSDLSRVKVSRRDLRTGKLLDWVLDCSGTNAPDLWLRDGDVIEVPDKSN